MCNGGKTVWNTRIYVCVHDFTIERKHNELSEEVKLRVPFSLCFEPPLRISILTGTDESVLGLLLLFLLLFLLGLNEMGFA